MTSKLAGVVDVRALLPAIESAVRRVCRTEDIFRDPLPFQAGPHDLRAERVVLVSVRDGWARPEDVAGVCPEHFYNAFHAHVYAALLGGARDDETIGAACVDAGIGAPWMIRAELVALDDRHAWGPVRGHADTVIALARRRALIHAAGRIAAAAQSGDVSIDDALRWLSETSP